MKKIVLLVAIPDSIHTVRWIEQIKSPRWQIHLFSSTPNEDFHSEMPPGCVVPHWCGFTRTRHLAVRLGLSKVALLVDGVGKFLEKKFPKYRVSRLTNVISKLRPDAVHSIEMQHAAYLTMAAKNAINAKFPTWIVTNWGSDIFLYGRLSQHRDRIKEVLKDCDYYSCECERDLLIAREFGFTNVALPVLPNTGGFDLHALKGSRDKRLTSTRKRIMLKGYQTWSGRALFGLTALEKCADLLVGYTLTIYSASEDVAIAAELFSDRTGITVEMIPAKASHAEILSLHSQARLSIGLGISDGISTSMLEAMVMGSFPIQSCTACANEWIETDVSGMIVPPEDPYLIATAIRRALADDKLVDDAAEINWQTALRRLNNVSLKSQYEAMYEQVLSDRPDN